MKIWSVIWKRKWILLNRIFFFLMGVSLGTVATVHRSPFIAAVIITLPAFLIKDWFERKQFVLLYVLGALVAMPISWKISSFFISGDEFTDYALIIIIPVMFVLGFLVAFYGEDFGKKE